MMSRAMLVHFTGRDINENEIQPTFLKKMRNPEIFKIVNSG